MNDNSSPNQKHGRFEALQGEPIVPPDAAEETAVDYHEAVPLTDECSKEGQPEETHPHYQGRFAAKHRQSADEATEMAEPEAPVIPEQIQKFHFHRSLPQRKRVHRCPQKKHTARSQSPPLTQFFPRRRCSGRSRRSPFLQRLNRKNGGVP